MSIASHGTNAASNSKPGGAGSADKEHDGSATREKEKETGAGTKASLEILDKPGLGALANKWDYEAEKKKKTIVEERFTFFQIENRLRKIAAEAVEAVRDRQNKESNQFRALEQKV